MVDVPQRAYPNSEETSSKPAASISGIAATIAVAGSVLTSLLFVVEFVFIAAHRARYHFDLEWMEGAIIDHVARVLSGRSLYVPPSVDFVPLIYTPFYYWVCAPFAALLGVDYFAARLVSLLATLACFALVFGIVYRESNVGGRRGLQAVLPAVVATGVYAGTFALSGGWLDLARVDSLFVALCLGALFTARWARTPGGLLAAALLTFLAFFTKQAGLAVLPGIAISLWALRGSRSAFLFAGATLALVGGSVLALHHVTGGWSTYYLFLVPASHPNDVVEYLNFWKVEVFAEVPFGIVFGLYFALGPGDEHSRERRWAVLPFAGFLIAAAYALRIHSGSYLNDKMPLHAAVALLAGLGLDAAVRGDSAERLRRRAFAYSAILCQLLGLIYPAEGYLPTRGDVAEGRALLNFARMFRGEVLFTEHGHLASQLGKPSTAHGMATFDIERMEKDPRNGRFLVESSYERALSAHRFAAIFTDDGLVMQPAIDRYYRPALYFHDEQRLTPKTGFGARPRNLYVPRR